MHAALEHRQAAQKRHHDERAGPQLPNLRAGQQVRTQLTNGSWTPATILAKCDMPRSYMLETANGSQVRRNRRHIAERPPPRTGPSAPAYHPGDHVTGNRALLQPAQPAAEQRLPRKQVSFQDEPPTAPPADNDSTAPCQAPQQPNHTSEECFSRYGRRLRKTQKYNV